MNISVELHRADQATVIFTPTLVERLIGRRSQERCAFRTYAVRGGNSWRWLNGDPVGPRIARKLDAAHRDLLVQRASASSGVAPPN